MCSRWLEIAYTRPYPVQYNINTCEYVEKISKAEGEGQSWPVLEYAHDDLWG